MAQECSVSNTRLVGTGVPGLDTILCGGLLPGACVVVEGAPGAGKTTLGLQFLYQGIVQYGEPGLVVSFEEFPEELHRDAQSYGWDLHTLERDRKLGLICTSPEVFLEDTMAPDGLFARYVEEMGPMRVMVDSITQMGNLSRDPFELRKLVYGIRNGFKRHGLTSVLITESDNVRRHGAPFERYICDVVICLEYRLVESSGARVRELEVVKSRARPHIAGRHLFDINDHGMVVAPDLAAIMPVPEAVTPVEPRFITTGSAGLDKMLAGGLVEGSTTIVAGSTGVGKTILGLQFLMAGAAAGERGLFISFEQTGSELARLSRGLKMPESQLGPDGLITVSCHRPGRGAMGLLVSGIVRMIQELKPQRIVVDALSTLAKAPMEPTRARADLTGFVSALCACPATSIVCDETPGIVGEFEVTGGVMVSSLVDNVIILRYVELGSEMRRAVSILKARYVSHDKEIKEYVIGPSGIELMSKFDVATGLLKGSPVRRDVEDFF